MQALNEAATGYLTVLKNNTWHEDAAYNYEYIVRLRDELAKGRQPPQTSRQQGMELGESRRAVARRRARRASRSTSRSQGDEKSPEAATRARPTEKERKG